MVIFFLTSGLAPGKDGVGDYTRMLASECVRHQHTCYLMALNDFFVSEPVETTETINGVSILTLRLPASMPWEERVNRAVEFRKNRAVDWTSLQFVSYGYTRKGIVRRLARYFEPIVKGSHLHMMFHETWIGSGVAPSLKARIIGRIQRHYIRELFQQLAPRLVTTSNGYYASQLHHLGITAVETPLFSNVPIRSIEQGPDIPEKLIEAGLCDRKGTHPNYWMGLFFGTLYPEWQEQPFMQILSSALAKTDRRACLVSAGRLGVHGKGRWQELTAKYGEAIDFMALGDCTESQISTLMQVADFGLAATPWRLIGKSSTVATMLDHGLPVIVTNHAFQPDLPSSYPVSPLLHRCDETLEAKLWAGLPRNAMRNRAAETAERLTGLMDKLSDPRPA